MKNYLLKFKTADRTPGRNSFHFTLELEDYWQYLLSQ